MSPGGTKHEVLSSASSSCTKYTQANGRRGGRVAGGPGTLKILIHSPGSQTGGLGGEAQESPRGPKRVLWRAKKELHESQHGTKRGPKESKKSPREVQGSLKEGPSEAQKATQSLRRPKMAQDRPREAQEAPRQAQEGSNMVQDGSKRGPGEPKRQPKKPKRGQKGGQERPKSSPREHQNANNSMSNTFAKTS